MNELLLQDALKLRRAGKLAEAADIYRQVLNVAPESFEALHALGIVRYQCGDLEEAERLIGQAVTVNPAAVDAQYNRGSLLLRLGRIEAAIACFDRAIALKPGYVEALTNRGNALVRLARHAEALNDFERTTSLRPELAQTWANRGAALFKLGRFADAVASYDKALALQPGHLESRLNRGDALIGLQRLDEALAEFDRGLEVQPQNADTWTRRGAALSQLDRREEAIAAYSRALELRPDHIEALNQRGNTLLVLRRFEEAARDFERVIARDPDFPWARGNLAYCHLHGCHWDGLEAEVTAVALAVRSGLPVCAPLPFLSLAGLAGGVDELSADALRGARVWVERQFPASAEPLWRGERYGHERIRLAYLSADFNDHAVARLSVGIFECHDRNRFETIAVSLGPSDDSRIRKRLEAAFETSIDVRGMKDAEVAAWLREREVDVAIDLNGFTAGCRPGILARRPAPVQAHFLGFPGTMGAPYIDYIFADETVIPPGQRSNYAEKVIYLPHSFLPNDGKRTIAEPMPRRSQAGLPEKGFVYCCFSGAFKITPAMFGVWMHLLDEVKDSVLWLPAGSSSSSGALRREAGRRGIDPMRLIFAPFTPTTEEHLSRLRLADLFLDTLPYNAHATACDALWAGVPLLTLQGAAFASRVAASALHAVGLTELVTQSINHYEALALELARDRERLQHIRQTLNRARSSSPLFDTIGFTRGLERAIAEICARNRRGEALESFYVRDLEQSR
ncbi:MAG TPA: tetratricopeptide repeat protein [Micropepsaceae bacterium]|nr:tetratricopeptide repeat protein [Micropepsaceae bacterium]